MAETEGGGQADFFISRAGADASIAVTIADILRADGYSVILEDRDFGNTGVVRAGHSASSAAHAHARRPARLSRKCCTLG